MNNWECCPRCNSNQVEIRNKKWFFKKAIGFFIVGLITVFFIPLVGIVLIGTGGGFVVAGYIWKDGLHCKQCNYVWQYNQAIVTEAEKEKARKKVELMEQLKQINKL